MAHPVPPAVITAEGRRWVGTRFQHQGRLCKTISHTGGVDCLGLVIGIAAALALQGHDRETGETISLAALDSLLYGNRPDGALLKAHMDRWLRPISAWEIQPADILLCRFDRNPQHIALVTDYPGGTLGIVHAHAQARAVVEHGLDDIWRARIVQAYRLPCVIVS